MGFSGFLICDLMYFVFVNIFKYLNIVSMDVVMGLLVFVMFYFIRGVCMWIGIYYLKY